MWYPKPPTRKQPSKEESGPDYDLIMPLIDAMVRHRLFLKCKYNPTPTEVKQFTNKIVRAIQEKYGSLELLRNKTTSEQLTPTLKNIISGILS